MTRSIRGAWLRLRVKLEQQGWPPEMLAKMRDVFYGGASAGVFLTLDGLDAHADERTIPIRDEIRAFVNELEARQ